MVLDTFIKSSYQQLEFFAFLYALLGMNWSYLMSGSAEYFLTFAKISDVETAFLFDKYKLSSKFIISWTYPPIDHLPFRFLSPVNAIAKIFISSVLVFAIIFLLTTLYKYDGLIFQGEKSVTIALMTGLYAATYIFCLFYGLIIRRELVEKLRIHEPTIMENGLIE